MPRSTSSVPKHRRTRKILTQAKGMRGRKSKIYRMAKQYVMRQGNHAFVQRKLRKRDFRRMWIARLSAALVPHGINYSRFIYGLTNANVDLNRKVLSNMAIEEPEAFAKIVEIAKQNQTPPAVAS